MKKDYFWKVNKELQMITGKMKKDYYNQKMNYNRNIYRKNMKYKK